MEAVSSACFHPVTALPGQTLCLKLQVPERKSIKTPAWVIRFEVSD